MNEYVSGAAASTSSMLGSAKGWSSGTLKSWADKLDGGSGGSTGPARQHVNAQAPKAGFNAFQIDANGTPRDPNEFRETHARSGGFGVVGKGVNHNAVKSIFAEAPPPPAGGGGKFGKFEENFYDDVSDESDDGSGGSASMPTGGAVVDIREASVVPISNALGFREISSLGAIAASGESGALFMDLSLPEIDGYYRDNFPEGTSETNVAPITNNFD